MAKMLALTLALIHSLQGMFASTSSGSSSSLLTAIASSRSDSAVPYDTFLLPLPGIKRWAPDFQQDPNEMEKNPFISRSYSPNMEELVDEVLIDDGHDEGSHDGMHPESQPCCSCCSCCSSMNQTGQSHSRFNGVLDDMLARFSVLVSEQLEPIPIHLRRRTGQEMTTLMVNQRSHYMHHWGVHNYDRLRTLLNAPGAFAGGPSANNRHAKEIEIEKSDEKRDSKSFIPTSYALQQVIGDGVPDKLKGDVSGFHTMKRSGDVSAVSLPSGSTMLRIPITAGPVKLRILRDTKTASQATVEQLHGDLQLTIHAKAGMEVHSLRFEKPSSFVSSTVAAEEVSSRTMPLTQPADTKNPTGFTAVATQILRQTLRENLTAL